MKLRPIIDAFLNEKRIKEQGIFNWEKVHYIINSHYKGKEDFGYTILSLLAIQSWLDQFPWSIQNSKSE